MNVASYKMYKHNIAQEESFIKRILKRPESVPLIFFVTSLTLWLAFLSKVYFENRTDKTTLEEVIPASHNYVENINDRYEEVSVQQVVYQNTNGEPVISYISDNTMDNIGNHSVNDDINDNMLKINQLTEQLMAQQKKTDELTRIVAQQKFELNSLINDAITKASTNDKNYIKDLNQLNSKAKLVETDETVLANTDYYNRVAISPSRTHSNFLQERINEFMDNSQQGTMHTGIDYVTKLKKESAIRQNEIRSISLKKGESIWMIAKRAYGDGFLYHKIMQANPQINEENARYLKPGTIIRVPI